MAVDQSKWRFVVTAMNGSTPSGSGMVFNAQQKTWGYHINQARTAQFIVKSNNTRADFMLNNDCLLKAYRKNRLGNWNLMFVGDLISTEEVGTGDSPLITCIAADPFWRLNKVALGVTLDSLGHGVAAAMGTAAAPVNLGAGLIFALAATNGPGWTGVNAGTWDAGIASSYFGPEYAIYFGAMIQECCAVLGGPDFEIVPNEPFANTSFTGSPIQLGVMNFYAHLGVATPTCIFEYGTGKHNVQSYDRLRSRDGYADSVYALPPGFPDAVAAGDLVAQTNNPGLYPTYGKLDYIVETDTAALGLRNALVSEHYNVLSQPRQVIQVQPRVNAPEDFGVDYHVGDVVTARAYDIESGKYRFNGTARIYGVDITLDENDNETVTLTLVPGG